MPAGAAAIAGVVIGASAAASAAQPSLPARSVAQILADVQAGVSKPLGPLTATVQQTANLGLPALPQVSGLGGESGPLSALAGTTSVSLWYLDQQHVRVATSTPMGERDLRLAGTQLWLWDSKTQTATHVLLPPQAGKAMAPSGAHAFGLNLHSESPLAAAGQALKLIGKSTNVALGPNVTVAGRPAYQISVSPKGQGSLVSKILIAVDSARHIPLQVQVYGRSSGSPVYQIGFTALTFGPPAMSNFTFNPPAGAKVKTVNIPARLPAGLSKLGPAGLAGIGSAGMPTIGQTTIGTTVMGQAPRRASRAALSRLRAEFIAHLPRGLTAAQRTDAIWKFEVSLVGRAGFPPIAASPGLIAPPRAALRQMIAHLPRNMPAAERAAIIRKIRMALAGQALGANGGGFINFKPAMGTSASAQGGPAVLGNGWTTVIATPANPAVWTAVQQLLSGKSPGPGVSAQPVPTGSGASGAPPLPPGAAAYQQVGGVTFASGASGPSAVSPALAGPGLAVLRALLRATTPVHGAWGSGRLLQTALLSVLVTSKGQILAGAVTPSVLYADALSLSR